MYVCVCVCVVGICLTCKIYLYKGFGVWGCQGCVHVYAYGCNIHAGHTGQRFRPQSLSALFLFECIIATTSVLCAVWVGCYGTQRRSLWVQYPTTFMWILWLELGSSSLHSECLYLLSHLADPPPYFLREGLPLNLEHKECPG